MGTSGFMGWRTMASRPHAIIDLHFFCRPSSFRGLQR